MYKTRKLKKEKTVSTKVTTTEFRVAFPAVFRPKHNDLSNKDEYSVVALFPKGTDLSALKAAAQEAAKKKWPKDMPKNLKSPFRDQADRAKVDEQTGKETLPQGYEAGAIYLNLKSAQRPGVVDQKMNEIIDESDFYGGCWARASINAYAYDQKGNRGVAFGLNNLQKLKDDDAFGNRSKPQDDFAAVETSSEDGEQGSASDLFG